MTKNNEVTTIVNYTGEEVTIAAHAIIKAVEPFPMPLAVLAMQEVIKKLESMGVVVTQPKIIL